MLVVGSVISGGALAQDAEVDKLLQRYRNEPSVLDELEGVRVGKIAIHPGLEETVSFSDNIFLRQRKRVSDVFFTTSPSVGLGASFKAIDFSMSLSQNIVKYLKYPSLDSDVGASALGYGAHYDTQFSYRWREINLWLREGLHGRETSVGIIQGQRTRILTNSARTGADYRGDTWSCGVFTGHEYVDYFDKDYKDLGNQQFLVGASLARKIAEQHEAGVRNSERWVWFRGERMNDQRMDEGAVFLSGALSPRLDYHLDMGVTRQTVTTDRHFLPDPNKQATTAIGSLALSYQITRKTSGTCAYLRSADIASFGNFQTVDQVLVGLQTRFSPLVTGELNLAAQSNEQSFSVAHTDKNVSAQTGIKYTPKQWLDFKVSYEYHRNFGSYTAYYSNLLSAGVAVRF